MEFLIGVLVFIIFCLVCFLWQKSDEVRSLERSYDKLADVRWELEEKLKTRANCISKC